MDDIVKAALQKWPNVPHCYGWLALDARGQWFLRDEPTQRAGDFPHIKGSRIEHPRLLEFIQRNYDHDADGSWFFQNGPQRVYVELEAAPWIWRLDIVADEARLISHTGVATSAGDPVVDEGGRLFVESPLGLGIVHTQDMHLAAGLVERATWSPSEMPFARMPARFGYRLKPAPSGG